MRRTTARAGINRLTFNIVGAPLETAANMRETLKLKPAHRAGALFLFPYIPLRETPLYNIAKKEGLLLETKKNLHYLSAANDRQFTLNMKERPELLTADEYNEICMEMLEFQEQNNRLTYSDSESEQGEASVEDKSFSLVEENSVSEEEPLPVDMPPATQSKGLSKPLSTFLADSSGRRAGAL